MQTALSALKHDVACQPTITFSELQDVAGFPDYWRREVLYRATD
jgi:hypothetical protein